MLKEILEEEKEADRRLSELATGDVNPDAAADGAKGQGSSGNITGKGQEAMARRNDDYGYERERDEGRYGGRSTSMYRERDEEGRFTSRDDDDYRSSRRSSWTDGGYRGGNEENDRYDGRSRGGQRSASMQGRDDYGRFTGDEDDGYSSRSGGRYSSQSRYDDEDDDRSGGYGGGRGMNESSGRQYSRESWERAQDGRSMGGQRSYGRGRGYDNQAYDHDGGRYQERSRSGSRSMPERDEYGRFVSDDDGGYSSRSSGRSSGRSRYSDEDDEGRSGGYGGGRGYTDSAGRHYTRESWERAQEGRMRGGQHSHGGRR